MKRESPFNESKGAGFTLLEILLVVAAIAILASIVIVAINPAKQLGETRDGERRADIHTILDGIYQYTIDASGTVPSMIVLSTICGSGGSTEICKTGAACSGLTDLSILTNSQKYLPTMPIDPKATSSVGTGYNVVKSSNGRITVCAPLAEQSASISVTK